MKKIYLAALILTFFSCSKGLQYYDNTVAASRLALPAYSEDGANTFGFMMNDSVWTVFGKKYFGDMFTPAAWHDNVVGVGFGSSGVPPIQIFTVSGELTVVKQNLMQKDYQTTINFFPDSPFLRTYLLSGSFSAPSSGWLTFIKRPIDIMHSDEYYFIDSSKPLTIQLTRFDTVAKICAGHFHGSVYSYTDSIIITDGRFDVKF